MTEEEFAEWRDHPLTEKFREAMRRHAADKRDEWMRASWEGGEADPITLSALKAQAIMASDLASMEYESVNSYLVED